jgi:SRSO17 transposase
MTPQEIAEVRPRLAGFAAEMLGDLPRKDQRAAATPVEELVRLAKIRWRIEHDYRELKAGLGLDHFEGRSLAGWHRHVTLAALAQAFCTLLRSDPKAPAPG